MSAKQPRDPLSKQRIVASAMAFADTQGADGLSMRKLAATLDVGVMSLYNHVANKDALLSAMIDQVLAEIEAPPVVDGSADSAGWRAAMRRSALSARDAYIRHPWAVATALRTAPGPVRMRYLDSLLAAFANSGLEPQAAHHAYHAYEMHISGFMLSRAAFPYDDVELKQVVTDFIASSDAEQFPHLVAHAREHLDDRGSDFEFGLDLLLDGFERLRLG